MPAFEIVTGTAPGPLSSILSGPVPPPGTRAVPSDVVGCSLESDGAQWGGFLGKLTAAQFASIQTYNSVIAVGSRLLLPNPAIVPRLLGTLEWSGSVWFVPAGEPIAQQWGMNNAFLADQTPGTLTQFKLFESPIIPDAFLPIKQKWEVSIMAQVINASGVAGCRMGVGIAGGQPTPLLSSADYNYTAGVNFTPGGMGGGFSNGSKYMGGRSSDGSLMCTNGGNGRLLRNSLQPGFSAGANRFYLMGLPSHVADRFVFEGGYSVISLGVAA